LQLKEFQERFRKNNLKMVAFTEPDIGNEMTAIAVLGDENKIAYKLTSSLPLALKEYS